MADENLKTYRGNCHCGAFSFEVTIAEIKVNQGCNCSICHKKGYAWVSPGEGQVRIVKGSIDSLTSYKFNDGAFVHRFCPGCGTALMGEALKSPPGMFTLINARAIQDLDIWSLEVKTYDGKALPPPYKAPEYTGLEPTAEVENGKIYHGSCHCGAVTLALKSKPLETLDPAVEADEVVDCNCSLCVRNAYVWFYPRLDQTAVSGQEHLSYRTFNSEFAFCRHCGVNMWNEVYEPTDKQSEALPDNNKPRHTRRLERRSISLRVLDDFDCNILQAQLKRLNGKAMTLGDADNL